jgi:multiple sugar transport system permease protein
VASGTQVFAEPQIIYSTHIGFVDPAWSPNQLAYTYAFSYGRFGVSAAISIEVLAIALVLALILILRTRFYSSELARASD